MVEDSAVALEEALVCLVPLVVLPLAVVVVVVAEPGSDRRRRNGSGQPLGLDLQESLVEVL